MGVGQGRWRGVTSLRAAALSERVGNLVAAVDAALPGRLEGLYLFGSVALGDYRAPQSDLDVLAVSASPWPESVPALARLHAELGREAGAPAFDAVYVTWEELRADPTAAVAPGVLVDGTFQPAGAFNANWAVWETVARYPVAARGPATPTVERGGARLRAFCRENLAGYWRGWADRVAAGALAPLTAPERERAVLWCVAGVLRLLYTVETGDIASKRAALTYGGRRLEPRFRPLVARAAALRAGRPAPRAAPGEAVMLAAMMRTVIALADVPVPKA